MQTYRKNPWGEEEGRRGWKWHRKFTLRAAQQLLTNENKTHVKMFTCMCMYYTVATFWTQKFKDHFFFSGKISLSTWANLELFFAFLREQVRQSNLARNEPLLDHPCEVDVDRPTDVTGIVRQDRTAVEKKVITVTVKLLRQIMRINDLDCIQHWTLDESLLKPCLHLHPDSALNVAKFCKVERSIQKSFADT